MRLAMYSLIAWHPSRSIQGIQAPLRWKRVIRIDSLFLSFMNGLSVLGILAKKSEVEILGLRRRQVFVSSASPVELSTGFSYYN